MLTDSERAALVEKLYAVADAFADAITENPPSSHYHLVSAKSALALQFMPIIERLLAERDVDALTDLFYEAITVAHGEGESCGRGRARIEGPTEHDAMSFGDMAIGGTVQPRPPVTPGLVGFSVSDRRKLAAEYASRATRTAAIADAVRSAKEAHCEPA